MHCEENLRAWGPQRRTWALLHQGVPTSFWFSEELNELPGNTDFRGTVFHLPVDAGPLCLLYCTEMSRVQHISLYENVFLLLSIPTVAHLCHPISLAARTSMARRAKAPKFALLRLHCEAHSWTEVGCDVCLGLAVISLLFFSRRHSFNKHPEPTRKSTRQCREDPRNAV